MEHKTDMVETRHRKWGTQEEQQIMTHQLKKRHNLQQRTNTLGKEAINQQKNILLQKILTAWKQIKKHNARTTANT